MADQTRHERLKLVLIPDILLDLRGRRPPGVDPVGLAGERGEVFHLLCVGDLDLPASEFEPVVHEARAVHRFDCGAATTPRIPPVLTPARTTARAGRARPSTDRSCPTCT